MRSKKPVVFLCSSKECKRVIDGLETLLRRECDVRLWYRDGFPPGSFSWDAIEKAIRTADFAVLVVAGDDINRSRRRQQKAPRDNVILEAGLALGVLGRERAFLAYSETDKPKIPTDLSGLTQVRYTASPVGLKKAADIIRDAITTTGPKDRFKDPERIVPYTLRAEISARFLESTIRSVDSFGGDLSWVRRDLPTFAALVKRGGVRIRFLTDTPNTPTIRKLQRLGMEVREYAAGDVPPVKGSIVDLDQESTSRALIVRKVVAPAHLQSARAPFQYSMVAYHGPRDHIAIRAMGALFDKYWTSARSL